MLNILLSRLKAQSETIMAEEHSGFRAGQRTTEQIFNLGLLRDKYQEYQQELYHVFVDFIKAFGRVGHAALWETMKRYNTNPNITQGIRKLYEEFTK